MNFQPKNFRRIADDTRPPKIRTDGSSTLILVKATGDAEYARTRGDKDAVVSRFDAQDLLLWAWAGQHHTDVFRLTREDLDKHYE